MSAHLLHRRFLLAAAMLSAAFIMTGATAGSIATAKSNRSSSLRVGSHKHKSTGATSKWTGQYSGQASGTFKLKLKQSGSKLSGTISLTGAGSLAVHGTLHGSTISFGTVGGGHVITYKGSVSGSSMSGTWKDATGGGSWSAHKKS